jgi:hypothetical protein
MAIVCIEYYKNTYFGEPIATAEFQRATTRAERAVIQITHGRAANYAALPEFQQAAIRDAICAQIEYYAINGTDVAVNGENGANGWTVGKVHVNGNAGNAALKNGASTMVCAAAIAALEQTGLLNPQVDTIGELPRAPYPWGYV